MPSSDFPKIVCDFWMVSDTGVAPGLYLSVTRRDSGMVYPSVWGPSRPFWFLRLRPFIEVK